MAEYDMFCFFIGVKMKLGHSHNKFGHSQSFYLGVQSPGNKFAKILGKVGNYNTRFGLKCQLFPIHSPE